MLDPVPVHSSPWTDQGYGTHLRRQPTDPTAHTPDTCRFRRQSPVPPVFFHRCRRRQPKAVGRHDGGDDLSSPAVTVTDEAAGGHDQP